MANIYRSVQTRFAGKFIPIFGTECVEIAEYILRDLFCHFVAFKNEIPDGANN
jgi:hypothetical protein